MTTGQSTSPSAASSTSPRDQYQHSLLWIVGAALQEAPWQESPLPSCPTNKHVSGWLWGGWCAEISMKVGDTPL